MYITPTVTSWSNASPVRPSKSTVWPLVGRPAMRERVLDLRLLRAVEHGARVVDAALRACCASCRTSSSESLPSHFAMSSSPSKISLDVLADRLRAELRLEHVLELPAEDARAPAEVRLEDLPDVHAGRHAERVEDDVDRRAVLEVRHVLFRQDAAR